MSDTALWAGCVAAEGGEEDGGATKSRTETLDITRTVRTMADG